MSLNPFSSFIWAGYECTYARVGNRKRLDMLHLSRHDEYCRIDYSLIKEMNIKTVREGLAWSQIDKGNGVYDFDRFEHMMKIAEEEGIQQIWDLNHFDYPDYLDPFSDKFVDKFAEYSKRAIEVIRRYQSGTIFIAPINEISFFAWIGADRGSWAPYLKGRNNGFKFKTQLVKALIEAMKAIKKLDKDVKFIHIDPFMRRVAKLPANKNAINHVLEFNEIVRFEAWDILYGRKLPELGGSPDLVDYIGINYYFHNQEWVLSRRRGSISHRAMDWYEKERVPFWMMVKDVVDRYKKPVVISETGSFGTLRTRWWKRTLAEIKDGLGEGLPIHGVCVYPTVDRPDIANYLIPNSGIWDFEKDDPMCLRIPHWRSINVIKRYSNFWNMPTTGQ